MGLAKENGLTIKIVSSDQISCAFDPEIGSTEGDGDATIQAWDDFAYPNFRTLSGSIEIKF